MKKKIFAKKTLSKNIFFYKYKNGSGIFNSSIEKLLKNKSFLNKYKNTFDLIFTSPPFPLLRKKKYGNKVGDEYIKWFSDFAEPLKQLLKKPTGSIVIEIGKGWEKKKPFLTTVDIEALLKFKEKGNYNLCQEFIWHNTAKLPSPAFWVNIKRVRVKDSFTRIWWLSPFLKPKANNKKILVKYSDKMKELLKKKKYNTGKRPSEHNIGDKSFLKNNKGAIPSNVLAFANTANDLKYFNYCEKKKLTKHRHECQKKLLSSLLNF